MRKSLSQCTTVYNITRLSFHVHFVVDHNVLLNSYTRLFQDLSAKVLIKE